MADKSDNGVIRPSSLPAISPAHLGARAAHLRGEGHTSPPLFRNDGAEPVRRFPLPHADARDAPATHIWRSRIARWPPDHPASGRLRAHVDVVEGPRPRIVIQRAGVDDDEVGPARSRPSRTPPRPAMLPATRTVAVVHGCEFTLGLVTNPPAETASGHRMRPPRVLRHGAPSRAKAKQGPLQDKLTASAGFTLMMWSGCTRSANVAL